MGKYASDHIGTLLSECVLNKGKGVVYMITPVARVLSNHSIKRHVTVPSYFLHTQEEKEGNNVRKLSLV